MTDSVMSEIVQLAIQGVFSVVFLALFMNERKSHDETRKELYSVFREVSGLSKPLIRRNQEDSAATHNG